MKFDTYIPCDALKPYIRALVISESSGEQVYKVLPGTEVVIGFQYRGALSRIEDGKEVSLTGSGVSGLHDTFSIFKNTVGTGTLLVYFKEGAFSNFFSQPLHELFSESVSLDNFLLRSELLILEEKLQSAKADEERIKTIEAFLLSRLKQIPVDALVTGALALIHKHKGNIRIKELAAQLHTSQSPLEKRFRSEVGTSPKKFADIIRLKHTMNTYKQGTSLTGLGYESGFYDQAHFIKAFKSFTGETPEAFFSGKE